MDDLPSNSTRRNPPAKPPAPAKEAPPAPEQVVSSSVSRRKKPLGKRFKETFFGGDSQSVTDYIVNDVVVPSVKDTIADVVTQAIERSLFGEVRSGTRRGASRYGGGHTAYNRYSSSSGERMFGGKPDAPNQNGVTRRGRAMHDFDEIVLSSKVEAEEVLDRLVARVEQYEVASVADLYTMLGEKPAFTDYKWGWLDLRDARTSRVRGGYLLDVPQPEPID